MAMEFMHPNDLCPISGGPCLPHKIRIPHQCSVLGRVSRCLPGLPLCSCQRCTSPIAITAPCLSISILCFHHCHPARQLVSVAVYNSSFDNIVALIFPTVGYCRHVVLHQPGTRMSIHTSVATLSLLSINREKAA